MIIETIALLCQTEDIDNENSRLLNKPAVYDAVPYTFHMKDVVGFYRNIITCIKDDEEEELEVTIIETSNGYETIIINNYTSFNEEYKNFHNANMYFKLN